MDKGRQEGTGNRQQFRLSATAKFSESQGKILAF